MVHGIPNISIPNIAYTVTQDIKMSLPVDSSSLMYSNFQHVSGIPAPEGTQGVSISKLNLLDVLIEQINQISQGSPNAGTRIPEYRFRETTAGKEPVYSRELTPFDSFDALLESFRKQILEAKKASAVMPYIPSPNAQAGALFSLVV